VKIGIVTGSSRSASESSRIGQWFKNEILTRENVEVEYVDLHETPMSFNPDVVWSGQDANTNDIKSRLSQCDGFVVITPEWGGMASPATMNMFIFMGSAVFADKPVYAVGVSDGRGGLRPITQMRSYAFKNTYACFIPEWLVVSDSKNNLLGGDADTENYVAGRAKYGVTTLIAYTEALSTVRSKNIRDLKNYEYGM
jgi:multimeric flavodoxin WrbA